jgi:ATP-binding cassette subfamily B protein
VTSDPTPEITEPDTTEAPTRLTRARIIFSFFRKDVRKQRKKLLGGMGFAVIYALSRVIEPWPLKVVLDQVLFHKPAHGFFMSPFTIFGTSAYEILAASALVLVVAAIVRGFAYFYEDFFLSSAAQEIVYSIRRRLYEHLHRLPLAFHQRRSTGDLLVRLSADIVMLREVLVDAVVNLGTGVVLVVLMTAVMLYVDPVLTLVSIGVMPLIALMSMFYGRRIRTTSRRQRKREGQVAAAMHEALSAMDVVQLHGASGREQERFQQLNRKSLKQGTEAVRLEARMNRSVEWALTAGTIAVLWAGTLRALHGAITPGELIVYISYLRAAYRPLRRASKSVQRSAKALAAAERIVEMLQTEPDLRDSPTARPAPTFRGRIVFENVGFAYSPGDTVLEGIDLRVSAGSTVAIVGATGSGKSTLASLVPRLFDPSAGRVTIDGLDIRDLTLESLRAQISVVRQDSILFGLSIAENIRYGKPDATDEEVQAAAAAAGIDDFLSELPSGYDTVLTERGTSLSGGQRQRVALARALVRRTPVLILDEPTTGLDAEKEREVTRAIRELTRETTTLLITHDMRLVQDADLVVVLDHGRVVGRGTYDELLARSPTLRRFAGAYDEVGHAPPAAPSSVDRGGPRVLFYSHNGIGVGHLQRQLDLASAYRARHPDAAVLLATGSTAAGMFEFPAGIDFFKLPALRPVDRKRTWVPRDLAVSRETVTEMRTELLESAVRSFSPDVLIADFMPAGPYGELLPALERLTRSGGRAVAGFRDIIDEPAFVRELWEETGVYETLREHYDAICVYGDPRVMNFADDYGLDEPDERLRYCGYLGRPRPAAPDSPVLERPFVIASCGGGADGAALLDAFIRSAAGIRSRIGGTWLAVSGPLMPPAEHARLSRLAALHDVELRRAVPGLRTYTAVADCVVAMPGYNTTCDVLSYGRNAVFVPRPGPSCEQLMRAERLRKWVRAEIVLEPSAELLRVSIERALASAPITAPLPLDGLERAVDVFDSCVELAPAAAA